MSKHEMELYERYRIMCIITAGKRDWKLLHNRIEGEKKMNNQIVDELQIAGALIQTVADAVANQFGAKDTEHLDISGNGQNLFCCLPISQSQHLILRFF